METLTPQIIGVVVGIVGGLTGGAVVLVIGLLQPQRVCPECRTPLPRFRRPTGLRQLLLSGWTCPACATEVNGRGQKIAA